MIKSVKLLTWLSLSNFLGINEAKFSKDKKKKRQLGTMIFAYALLGLLLIFYTGLMAYSLIMFQMTSIIPMYLATIISLFAFMFTVFRAGPELFSVKGYEMLIVLPVKPAAIVISRFLTLYLVDMVISILATATVLIVCAISVSLPPMFYILMALAAFILPLLPMTLSMIVGTVIYALTSRMRHKNIMQIVFSMAFLALYFFFMQKTNEDPNVIVDILTVVIQAFRKIYPPAFWFSEGVHGNLLMYLLFFAVSFGIFFLFAFLVGKFFGKLCTSLISQAAKRNYVMKEEKKKSTFRACFFRERKRYFSSAVYVMNTAIGYLMVVALSCMVAFGGASALNFTIPTELIAPFAPFAMGMFLNFSPTTTSAFSIEGKCFWLTQTLPLRLKDIIHAKLIINLMFALPSALISTAILAFAFRPNVVDLIVWIVLPVIYVLFGTVLGLFLNVKMPMMFWDSEAQVIKQGKAVMMMMLFALLSVLVPIVLIALIGISFALWISLATAAVLMIVTLLLYKKLMAMRLNDLMQA